MESDLRKIECWVCGKEKFALIQIEVAQDTFSRGKGICFECFKKGEVDEMIFIKTQKFIQEQVASAKERKSYWEGELKKFGL